MTDKQQKILQMTKDICRHQNVCTDVCKPISACDALRYAERAVEAGYCKQSEGEWISNELGGYKYAFYCSECGWVDGYPFNDRHKFCPNCGAKMKGAGNE